MRIPSVHQHDVEGDESFMTPMIDVVFLLLIFFVCASIGQKPEQTVAVPLAAGSIEATDPLTPPEPLGEVMIHLSRDVAGDRTLAELNGRTFADWEPLRATLRELAELAPEIPVILDIDSNVPLGDVVDIYDTSRSAGFETIRFATDPPGKS